ncbi:RNA polymerase sigma-70 factor (ECF subfamily) [Chitinophaga skermanii]|uniref:RNA polymerase sigma-70 factor (ECF subfamily) n=1 Tax=Chitinophaga skermanii TaxID=331697 RepID=A0A327Q3Z7_9BACT|nr:sigma-70 family RNA polymerase sigma factor [Chitinophaga skermanii]RAI98644.1 RNA polymerase sigma-70 factor (ECF subfamily) [Chitinophaga skermanii]
MDSGLDIDQATITGFSTGDEKAFQQVFDLLFRPLCFFAGKFTGQKEEAEDAVSQAFHKLWIHRAGFNALPAIRTFLYTTVKNHCLDLLKHKAVVDHAHHNIRISQLNADSFAESRMMQAQLLQVIFAEIEHLPAHYRDVLMLSFVEELSVAEIAARINKSENHVRADRSRGLALLRASLKNKKLLEAALLLWTLYEQGYFHR